MRLFTIGFEKRKSDEFFETLKANRIGLLADIRAIAFSRRKEFSKTALSGRLMEMGIEYVHLQELGGPKELRDKVRADGDYEYFFKRYELHLDEQTESLEILQDLVRRETVCLLCYERDVDRCHRRAVAERLEKSVGERLRVSHL